MLEGGALVLHADVVDEPHTEAENAGRDDFRSRGVGSSGIAGPGAIVAGLLFVYFGLPAFWVKPLIGLPGAERVVKPVVEPIGWLMRQVKPYDAYIRWQSDLVGLK